MREKEKKNIDKIIMTTDEEPWSWSLEAGGITENVMGKGKRLILFENRPQQHMA